MRFTVLVIACVALLATSAVSYAGPFTGVPTIPASDNEFGSDTIVQSGIGAHITVGYARFSLKSVLPTISSLGTTLVAGGTQSQDVGAFIASAEAFKLIDSKEGSMVRVGGWLSTPRKATGSQSNETVGEVHLGYRFNQNIGIEVGQFVSDGQYAFGKNSAYLTYEIPPTPEADVAFQFGIGTITKSDSTVMTGMPNMSRKTDFSAFVNGSYGMQHDTTLNVGVWFLRQQFSMPAFTYISSSGSTPVDATSANENIINWTLSIGKKF